MNIQQSSQSIIKKPLAGVLDYCRAHYELLFPTVPKSTAEITAEQTPKKVSRLLRANGESGDFTTPKQRKENKIAVLGTDPKTILSFRGLTLTSQDFGKPDRTRTDYTLSGDLFGKQVKAVLESDKMPWAQE